MQRSIWYFFLFYGTIAKDSLSAAADNRRAGKKKTAIARRRSRPAICSQTIFIKAGVIFHWQQQRNLRPRQQGKRRGKRNRPEPGKSQRLPAVRRAGKRPKPQKQPRNRAPARREICRRTGKTWRPALACCCWRRS